MDISNCKHCGYPPIELRCTEIHGTLGKTYEIKRNPVFVCMRQECVEIQLKKIEEEKRIEAINSWNSKNNTEF